MIDIGLWIGYLLAIAGAAGMLVFSIRNIIGNPKNAKFTLIGVGAIIVLFLFSWIISSSDLTPRMINLQASESMSKMIGAGFIMLYLMGIITVGAIFYVEFKKIFSRK